MRLGKRIAATLKALSIIWSGEDRSLFGAGAGFDASAPGDAPQAKGPGKLWENSTIAAALGFIGEATAQPQFQVRSRTQRVAERINTNHPMIDLIETPNPHYDGEALMAATATALVVAGDAYWLKARGDGDLPVELWWEPPWRMRPVWDPAGSKFITHYERTINGVAKKVECKDVVHFRDGLDFDNPRQGMPRLKPVLDEIAADNEVPRYIRTILENSGVVGVMIMPKGDGEIDKPNRETIKALWRALVTGKRRGDPLVLSHPADVVFPANGPEKLALDRLAKLPEGRILAMTRINAQTLNLPSGHDTKTFANYKEARCASYEDCAVPLSRRMAGTMRRQLLPDFGDDPRRTWVTADWSGVEALAINARANADRAIVLFGGNLGTWNESRAIAGLPSLPDEDGRGDKFAFEVVKGPAPQPSADDKKAPEPDADKDEEEGDDDE